MNEKHLDIKLTKYLDQSSEQHLTFNIRFLMRHLDRRIIDTMKACVKSSLNINVPGWLK